MSEYRARMRTIKARSMRMSANRDHDFRRTEPRNLLRDLVKKHKREVEQVKRIAGAE
jgi:hypothetical protein